jgi:hypothetical protein
VLTAEGRMRPAGLHAFAARSTDRTAVYAYEQRQSATLDEEKELTPPSKRRSVTEPSDGEAPV